MDNTISIEHDNESSENNLNPELINRNRLQGLNFGFLLDIKVPDEYICSKPSNLKYDDKNFKRSVNDNYRKLMMSCFLFEISFRTSSKYKIAGMIRSVLEKMVIFYFGKSQGQLVKDKDNLLYDFKEELDRDVFEQFKNDLNDIHACQNYPHHEESSLKDDVKAAYNKNTSKDMFNKLFYVVSIIFKNPFVKIKYDRLPFLKDKYLYFINENANIDKYQHFTCTGININDADSEELRIIRPKAIIREESRDNDREQLSISILQEFDRLSKDSYMISESIVTEDRYIYFMKWNSNYSFWRDYTYGLQSKDLERKLYLIKQLVQIVYFLSEIKYNEDYEGKIEISAKISHRNINPNSIIIHMSCLEEEPYVSLAFFDHAKVYSEKHDYGTKHVLGMLRADLEGKAKNKKKSLEYLPGEYIIPVIEKMVEKDGSISWQNSQIMDIYSIAVLSLRLLLDYSGDMSIQIIFNKISSIESDKQTPKCVRVLLDTFFNIYKSLQKNEYDSFDKNNFIRLDTLYNQIKDAYDGISQKSLANFNPVDDAEKELDNNTLCSEEALENIETNTHSVELNSDSSQNNNNTESESFLKRLFGKKK